MAKHHISLSEWVLKFLDTVDEQSPGKGIQHCGYVVAEVRVLQPETGRKQTERLLAYPRDIMVSSY